MKPTAFILFLLLCCPASRGQTSNVIATITDSDGQTWNNGTYTITFIPSPSNSSLPSWNGSPMTQAQQGPYTGSMNGSGMLTVSLPDNAFITPSGSKYLFILCSNTSAPCSQVQTPVIGASPNLSTTLSNGITAPRFPALGSASRGYEDGEVIPTPQQGQTYFNVTSGAVRQWNNGAWSGVPSYYVAADNTGTTDATASINAAITAAVAGNNGNGGIVHLPSGKYALKTAANGLTLNGSHISFICDPGAILQAQLGYTGSNAMLNVSGNPTDILIQGCVFDANGIAATGPFVSGSANRIYLDNIECKNSTSTCVVGFLRTSGLLQMTNSWIHNDNKGFYDYAGNGPTATHRIDYNSFDTITDSANAIAIGSSGIGLSEASHNNFTNITAGTQEVLYSFGADKVDHHDNYFNNVIGCIHDDTPGGGSISFNQCVNATALVSFFGEAASYLTMEGNLCFGASSEACLILGEGANVSPSSLLTQFQSFNSSSCCTAGPNVVLASDSTDHQGNSTASLVATASGIFTTGTLWYFTFGSAQGQFGGFEQLWVKPTSGNVNGGTLSLVCSVSAALATHDLIVPLSNVTMLNGTWYHLIQYANGWQGAVGGNGGSNNGWNSCGVIVNSSSPSLVVKFDDFETGPINQGDSIINNKSSAVAGTGGMRWGAQSGLIVADNHVYYPGGAIGAAYENLSSTGTVFQNNESIFTIGAFYPSGPNTGGTHLVSDATASASSVIASNDQTNAALEYSLSNAGTLVFNITGAGVPAAGLCMAGSSGSIYLRTDGGAPTTLYVCTAGTWTAK